MRPDFGVTGLPFINNQAGIFKTAGLIEVMTLLPELTVEALNKRILSWLTRLN